MNLIETSCPNCKKKIFLDLEEVVSDSATRPIKCSQCGTEFVFGFDADASVVEEQPSDTNAPDQNGEENLHERRTKLVKKVVLKKVPKARPKADKYILVIEDSEITRGQIHDLFADDVQHVLLSENAEDGLAQLKRKQPDMLIVDMVLPRMSGAQFIAIVRNYIPTNHIVIFTAAHATNLDIFDESMEGINLVFRGGADSFEELRDKGMQILGLA